MRLLTRLTSFWRNLTRRGRVERELDEELRTSFELLVDENVRAGLRFEEARRAAGAELRIESVKEQVREVRAGSIVETLFQDLRYAARLLLKNPLFTLTAAVSLSIGIGATTTVFTVGNGLLLTAPSGVSDPDRLLEIVQAEEGRGGVEPAQYPDYLAIRERAKSLAGVYGYQLNLEPLSLRAADTSERIFGMFTTLNFFSVLGVQPAAGRLFGPGDSERPGDAPFVVLSYGFWTRRFNRDPTLSAGR